MTPQPIDELAARRGAKAHDAERRNARRTALLDDLEEIDRELYDSMYRLLDGELLVSTEAVREIVNRADDIVIRLIVAERTRIGLG